MLPPLAGILAAPEGQPDMLVEGALDLLAALLRPSRPEARLPGCNVNRSAVAHGVEARPAALPVVDVEAWPGPQFYSPGGSVLQDALRVHAAASGPVLQLLSASDDNGILQSCCEYWRYEQLGAGMQAARMTEAEHVCTTFL